MTDQELRVDGNAIAGELGEIFAGEMTSARIACGGCGKVEPIGAEHAYTQAPSAVLRCCHCENVLLVLSRARDRLILGLGRTSWLEIADQS